MKQSRPFPLIAAIAVFLAVAALTYSLVFYVSRAMYPDMTRGEAARNDQLAASIISTGAVSSDDLNWSLQVLQTPAPSDEPLLTHTRHLSVMLSLMKLRTFAPGQKEQLYQATAGFLASRDTQDRIGAVAVMRATKDKRAIPSVKALLNDPDAFTRQVARKTLRVLKR